MRKRMAKSGPIIEQAIKETLKAAKWKSTYWLSKELADQISRSNLYGYLAGTNDLTSGKLKAINKVLGLRYTDE